MRVLAIAAAAALLLAPPARAQEHAHSHGEAESLGVVHFPTSCRGVDAQFTRAVALLHSFGYEESRRAFEEVAAKDPSCGIAYWGIAMTWYHPIWAPPNPTELAAGRDAVKRAEELGAKTDRERGYIAAIGTFYRESERVPHDAPRRTRRRSEIFRGVCPRTTRRRSSTPSRSARRRPRTIRRTPSRSARRRS
jgi:hypothetical protein